MMELNYDYYDYYIALLILCNLLWGACIFLILLQKKSIIVLIIGSAIGIGYIFLYRNRLSEYRLVSLSVQLYGTYSSYQESSQFRANFGTTSKRLLEL